MLTLLFALFVVFSIIRDIFDKSDTIVVVQKPRGSFPALWFVVAIFIGYFLLREDSVENETNNLNPTGTQEIPHKTLKNEYDEF
ncbi:MAG: hypothetical protein ABL927_15110 [Bdellovibrionales bacterium]